ncbi:MAG: hypothetical protein Q6365_022220 [Candidatus Sigynarchaeota archaeon]
MSQQRSKNLRQKPPQVTENLPPVMELAPNGQSVSHGNREPGILHPPCAGPIPGPADPSDRIRELEIHLRALAAVIQRRIQKEMSI